MSKNFICTSSTCTLPSYSDLTKITVHGARERNLKQICFQIPKGKLVVLTGPSGSGKSSIAVEVLQKECLRQYLESLGMTTDHIAKAKVDSILGLSPAIGISQRITDFNPRSTVGTKTGIFTILRGLFASIGCQPCTDCGKRVKQPLQSKNRLTTIEEMKPDSIKKKTRSYFDCPYCGCQLEKLEMAHFSLNTAAGACEVCKGAGNEVCVDIHRLLHEDKSIREGAVGFWDEGVAEYYEAVIQAAAKHYKFSFDTNSKLQDYTKEQRDFLLYGVTFPAFVKAYKNIKPAAKVRDGKFEGIIPYLLSRYKSNPYKLPHEIKKYISCKSCEACRSTGLGKIGREVTIHEKRIMDVVGLNLCDLLAWMHRLEEQMSEEELCVFAALSDALKERISHVIEVGLDYLSLNRSLPSLSAGESQRLRLACVVGSGLTGVLYVLDEPTAGLHPHDTAKLLRTLRKIKESGNTVLVVAHDLSLIREADYIIEVGPGGGNTGGEIVAVGTLSEIMASRTSVTGSYLCRTPKMRHNSFCLKSENTLIIRGAREHNLQNIDVRIPLNCFVVMTGVSGSGKSTLLFDILDKAARKYFNHATEEPGQHLSIQGLHHFHRLVTVDQATIRSTQSARSNVATYTKLFDLIRDLFASLPEAKICGFGPDKFSFNISEERCKNCNGAGFVSIDMAFMPDVETECLVCSGTRFSEKLLSIKFHGHNISDILAMTVRDATTLFRTHQNIFLLLDLMSRVGLDYLTLGQSTASLSGGEAQRIKLAAELSKSGKESTLFLLDEPTAGLHVQEVEKLLCILRELVSKGNSVVVIEHNLDVISAADAIIDFGPGGGDAGGKIVATGTPQEIAANPDSLTGRCLKAYL